MQGCQSRCMGTNMDRLAIVHTELLEIDTYSVFSWIFFTTVYDALLLLVYFVAQIVWGCWGLLWDLVSFHIVFWVFPYFRAPKDSPGYSCIFPVQQELQVPCFIEDGDWGPGPDCPCYVDITAFRPIEWVELEMTCVFTKHPYAFYFHYLPVLCTHIFSTVSFLLLFWHFEPFPFV